MRERFLEALRWLAQRSDVPRERFPDVVVYWRARAMRLLAYLGVVANVIQLPMFLLNGSSAGRVLSLLVSLGSMLVMYRALAVGPRGLTAVGLVMVPLWLGVMAWGCYTGNGLIDAGVFAGVSAVIQGGLFLGVPGLLAAALGFVAITAVIAVLMAQGRLPSSEVHLTRGTIAVLAPTLITSVILVCAVLIALNWLLRRQGWHKCA